MIILFTLLGLLGLGGGAWSIVDGLPYLVLERGFTQVIVGTVLATGGVLLLGLACVLAELKRARQSLTNALMAASVASMAGERADPPVIVSAAAPMAAAAADRSSPMIGAAGAAAAVGAALAAGGSRDDPGPPDVQTPPQEAVADSSEPDLFASPSDDRPEMTDMSAQAEQVVPAEPAIGTESDPAKAAAPASTPEDAPERASDPRDVFVEPLVPAPVEAEMRPDIDDPFADAIRDAVPADPLEQANAPAADAEELAMRDDTPWPNDDDALRDDTPALAPALDPAARIEPSLPWPAEPDPPQERFRREPAMPDVATSDDEFGFLRESLSGRAAGREEVALPDVRERGPTATAGGWMAPRSDRQEPWFGDRDDRSGDEATILQDEAAAESGPGDLAPPPWPPVTRQPWPIDERFDDAGPGDGDDAPTHAAGTTGEPALENATAANPGPIEEPAPADDPAPPAASDEGVVGAYQVGDAQFTIFADGSIQARTPDGDYTFGSMDELKTYLASEKSRLGA